MSWGLKPLFLFTWKLAKIVTRILIPSHYVYIPELVTEPLDGLFHTYPVIKHSGVDNCIIKLFESLIVVVVNVFPTVHGRTGMTTMLLLH